jgi:hypothetical protein
MPPNTNIGPKTSAKTNTKTHEEVLVEADEVWRKIKEGDKEESIRRQHKDFASTLPVVFKMMVTKVYYRVVLKEWLSNLTPKDWASNSAKMEGQAKYVACHFRYVNRELPQQVLEKRSKEVYEETLKSLKTDDDLFKACAEEAEENAKAVREEATEKLRQRVFALLKEQNGLANQSGAGAVPVGGSFN